MKWLQLTLALALLAGRGASAEQIEGISAIVGDQVILSSEVETATRLVLQHLKDQEGYLGPEHRAQIREQALQSLINEKLIHDFAVHRNLAATEEEIDDAIRGIASEEGATEEQVYAAALEQGLSRSEYRSQLASHITRVKVFSGVVQSRVTVSEQEVRELFDERYASQEPGLRVRVRHILIPWPDEEAEEKRDRMREIAETIRQRAIETGAFANLARQYSRAPSAEAGGLSTFKQDEVAPQIGEHVFGLPAGEITPVIETPHGLNIFQIVNRFDPAEVKYQDVAAELRVELQERKTMPEYERWLEELRKNQYVHILDPVPR